MNDYDKAGRYLVKREPAGFFRWLVGNPRVSFQGWIDARRVALPNQSDLTNDLVAAVSGGGELEAICVELEAEARSDALARLLEYLARFWTEPGGPDSIPVSCVSGIVLDLTGRSPARELNLRSSFVPGCHLELTILRRHMADENAASLVASVAAGTISPWLLPWVPLMQGGGESGTILNWVRAAEGHLPDERDRADFGLLAKLFATLAGRRREWNQVLRGWNMNTSPFLDEIRDQIRDQIRDESRAEEARTLVVRLGRQKFGKAPSKRHHKALEAIVELSLLEALAERLLLVDSWGELLGNDSLVEPPGRRLS